MSMYPDDWHWPSSPSATSLAVGKSLDSPTPRLPSCVTGLQAALATAMPCPDPIETGCILLSTRAFVGAGALMLDSGSMIAGLAQGEEEGVDVADEAGRGD